MEISMLKKLNDIKISGSRDRVGNFLL